MVTRKTRAPFVVCGLFALMASGCGDDGTADSETTSAASTSRGSSTGEQMTASTLDTSGSSGADTTSGSSTTGGGGTGSMTGSESGESSGSSTGTSSGAFEDPRTYEAFWAASPEQCEMMQKQGVNCYYTVSFCPDGRTAAVWTDIVGEGTYSFDGTSIVAEWSDVRFSPVAFEYTAETDTLEDDVFSETWERNTEFFLLDCD